MAAVEDGRLAAAVRDLGEYGGGEPLGGLRGGEGGAVAAHAGVHPPGERRQVGFVVGGLAEGVDHRACRADRGEALAAHVADHHPQAVPGVDGLVEVAADPGLRGGGHVQRLDGDTADPLRQRSQHHRLGGLGDRADVVQGALALQPDVAGVAGAGGDGGEGAAGEPGGGLVVEHLDGDDHDQGEQPEAHGGADRPHRGGQCGGGGQQPADGEVPGRGEGHSADHHGQHDRRHRGAAAPAGGRAAAPELLGRRHIAERIGANRKYRAAADEGPTAPPATGSNSRQGLIVPVSAVTIACPAGHSRRGGRWAILRSPLREEIDHPWPHGPSPPRLPAAGSSAI
ncbi:hypothetical protein SBRY_40243 [Actinacidiphila bryophytorum]|uniref:Uncharacterized protein n=1 Tax=Actinacidiphila bryophytorum TaxID=1436133 RepID=A0A9W4H2K2_9ACTN|nr:hypothetical protein SBRY_40243 [Actinacidiphila bryophytorum]